VFRRGITGAFHCLQGLASFLLANNKKAPQVQGFEPDER
jgi:hypothetical protein